MSNGYKLFSPVDSDQYVTYSRNRNLVLLTPSWSETKVPYFEFEVLALKIYIINYHIVIILVIFEESNEKDFYYFNCVLNSFRLDGDG